MGNDTGYTPQINLGHQTSALNWAIFVDVAPHLFEPPKRHPATKLSSFIPSPRSMGISGS